MTVNLIKSNITKWGLICIPQGGSLPQIGRWLGQGAFVTQSPQEFMLQGRLSRLTLLPHPFTLMNNATICKNIQQKQQSLILLGGGGGGKFEKEDLLSCSSSVSVCLHAGVYTCLPGKGATDRITGSVTEAPGQKEKEHGSIQEIVVISS